MTDIVIYADKAIDLLREVVKGKEGFVYTEGRAGSCYYQEGGGPSCLVGVALFSAGAPLSFLEWADENGGAAEYLSVANYPGIRITDDAANVFQAAQSVQDNGMDWATALTEAERRYAEVTA